MSDDVYKAMWNRSLFFSEKFQINRFIIDQRSIGKVSFSARGWVVIKVFPTLKKILPGSVHAAVLKSENLAHKSGMTFLAKAFEKLSGYQVGFFSDEAEGVAWLSGETVNVR